MKAVMVDASTERGGTVRDARSVRNRSPRLRSNRTAIALESGDLVRASCTHASLGVFEADVLDVSLHGARLALSNAGRGGNAVLLGDQLEPLIIHCNGELVYHGSGTVTRALERDDQVELGVELQHAAVELDRVHRSTARRSAQQRWAEAHQALRDQVVGPQFRSWVADVASFLDTTRRFLDREEREISLFDRATQEAVSDELLTAVTPDIIQRMNEAALELGALARTVPASAEQEHRSFLQSRLNPYLEAAPFIWRAKHKPLGYAGDYEMMNMLYRDHREGATLFGKALNVWATQQPAARANINRIDYIGEKLQAALANKPAGERLRVASIGCGPAREIYAFLSAFPALGARLDVALIDQEERAIAHCERTLAPLAARTGARVRVIKESARRLLTDRELGSALGKCDLIYSAGLFDYLAARSFSALLTVLYKALDDQGTLLVGNVATHNPDRAQMEYVAEWFLHHRSPAELLALTTGLTPEPSRVAVESEPSGLNLFLTVDRA
ncbi:MAG: SAM-dependent methyltransferase [Myxococcaceae bacterium]|nr:SAM-dependent methyltransferase [Myxococcaceae bacterium]